MRLVNNLHYSIFNLHFNVITFSPGVLSYQPPFQVVALSVASLLQERNTNGRQYRILSCIKTTRTLYVGVS